MSSLRAAGADGFYIDPSRYDPQRGRGSANAIAGSHPLGVRAKRLRSEGILTIRFEMPYDSTCGGCGAAVSHGVRFNAAKSRVGAYLSTPVWEFRMRCVSHSGCRTEFVIRTDPAAGEYEFVSGIVRRTKDFIPELDDGLGRTGGSLHGAPSVEAARLARAGDAMAALQHTVDDAARAAAAEARFNALREDSERRYADPLSSQGAAKAVWRARAQAEKFAAAAGAARGLTAPLAAPLAGEDEAEALDAWHAARMAVAAGGEDREAAQRRRRLESDLGGIFSTSLTHRAPQRPAPPPLPPPPAPPPRAHALLLHSKTGIAGIVAAGLAARKAERLYEAKAPLAEGLAVTASLRARSGFSAHGGAGPRVSLRAGPVQPPRSLLSLLPAGTRLVSSASSSAR
jgi:coiled-coil domain-containing protein 130